MRKSIIISILTILTVGFFSSCSTNDDETLKMDDPFLVRIEVLAKPEFNDTGKMAAIRHTTIEAINYEESLVELPYIVEFMFDPAIWKQNYLSNTGAVDVSGSAIMCWAEPVMVYNQQNYFKGVFLYVNGELVDSDTGFPGKPGWWTTGYTFSTPIGIF